MHRFRYALCNEVFQKWPFPDACRAVRAAGYTGIELAPFTLGENPALLTQEERREYRRAMEAEGLEFVGLHWLLVGPKGIHVTTPERAVRERSWEYVRDLVDLCADLGPGGVMVFGSPDGRRSTGGSTREESTKRFEEGFAWLAPHAEARGVTVLVEALSPAQCDVVQTLEEAAGIVRRIGSPAIRTMFDTHNAVEEREPHAQLVEKHYEYIRHIHLNEMDGRYPGAGDYDFKPVLDVLRRRAYRGWVSIEVFDFTPGPEKIARDTMQHLESELTKIAA